MARRSDQVFQLSLTEIAFTVSFILLLLLGYLVFKEQAERRAAQEALEHVNSLEQATAAMKQSQKEFEQRLGRSGVANPSETISRLVEAEKVRTERDLLRQQVENLGAKLTALTELQKAIESAAPADREKATREAVASALALANEVEKAANAASASGASPRGGNPARTNATAREQQVEYVKQALATAAALRADFKQQFGTETVSADAVHQAVRDAKSFREMAKSGATVDVVKKENSDLRGQVAYLKNRLDARGGRDYPPCWADESGKVEFLFAIGLRPDGVVITRAWPEKRAADAASLPGVSAALAGAHSHRDFPSAVQPVFDWSRHHDPECRHYVQLRSTIADAVQSDRARLMVENFFYKVEARR